MKVKAAAVVIATAALSFAAVSSASAQPLRHLAKHTTAPPQVTGTRLQTGLLPASAYGAGFKIQASLNSGGKLLSTHAVRHPSSMSCGAFEGFIYASGFGNTAGTLDLYLNPSPFTNYPNTIFYGFQDVLQFATTSSATTFFTQAQAKYSACHSFTEPNPSDTSPGGGTYDVNNLSQSKTTVGGDQAWADTQSVALSEDPGLTVYIDVLFVVSGANVYSLWNESGTNDEPSPTLMVKLMHKVQALYPHHK